MLSEKDNFTPPNNFFGAGHMVVPFNSLEFYKVPIKPEHELLRKVIRRYTEESLSPIWKDIELNDEIPKDILSELAEQGFFAIGIPEKYGGQGGDQISKMIVIEELSRVIPSLGVILDTTDFPVLALLLWGTEEQKNKFLPVIANGAAAAGAYTEPQAGSWVAGITTTAEKQGDYYVINGRKIFISTIDYAKYIVVLARTQPISRESPHKGMSLFIVENDSPGLIIGNKINTMSMRGDRPYELIFDNMKIPKDHLIGKEGMGYYYTMILLNFTRINIAAQAVGIAQGAFEKAMDYSVKRDAFGKKIYQFESISFKIADMFTKIQSARLLTYWAANLSEQQFKSPDKALPEVALAGSVAKIFATEAAEYCARQAVQIHGGYGVDFETGIERYLRDSIVTTIYEGTNEIQRYIIARFLPQVMYNTKLPIG